MNTMQTTTSASSESTAKQGKSSPVSQEWTVAAQKHNHSGLTLRYKLDAQPKQGQALTLQLEFLGVTFDDAQIQMRIDSELGAAQSASSQVAMQKLGDGFRMPLSKSKPNVQSLTLTPLKDGMHYIQFQMSQAGRTSATSIAIPVGDGPFATPTLGEVQTTPSGEKIIVMPAAK